MTKEDGVFLQKSRAKIEEQYVQVISELPEFFQGIQQKMKNCAPKTALAMKYLYVTMPYSDMGNYSFETFLDYASLGVYLWENNQDVQRLPEEIFLNYVLYHRVNEEEIAPCRTLFYEDMKERIKKVSGQEAAIEINYWCAEKATYQSTDDRTLSALTIYLRGNGRCGEESTFLVNALRSAGIPARQVYAPKWSHCDDNHAWVELWDNGTWYFTGACEPLLILNKGWFTNASSRAMMIHSRWFDSPQNASKMGEIIGKEGKVTMLNELKRYAATRKITVEVKDKEGKPIEHAKVQFEVLNYSEYAKIAEEITDKNGRVFLTTGLGSLHIHVNKDKICADAFMDTRKEEICSIRWEDTKLTECWVDYDMIAPVDTPINTDMPTKEQKEKGMIRLKEAARKRMERVNNWRNTQRELFLSKDSKNYDLRQEMVKVLTKKDQSDCICAVLEEHLQYALPYKESYPQEIFVPYILNPRVDDEVLRSYRKEIFDIFSIEEQECFRNNPISIWSEIEKRIKSCPEQERSSVITIPAACLKLGIGSRRSKEILFVAIARTLGIPARLNPKDRSMEFWKDGKFYPVLPEKEKNAYLILKGTDCTIWKYFQNWSLAKLETGEYHSLRLGEESWREQRLEFPLEEGRYRLITSNRLPNGNIFSSQYEFFVEAGQTKECEMMLRKAKLQDMLDQIELPEFYVKKADQTKVAASELTDGEKKIFIWLEESEEPTEHILNEMLGQKEAFKLCAKRIIFLVRTKEALKDPTISKALEAFPDVTILYDDFEENVDTLGRRMYVDPEKLPLILVTGGRLNGIYAASGYNVGTGDMLLRLM